MVQGMLKVLAPIARRHVRAGNDFEIGPGELERLGRGQQKTPMVVQHIADCEPFLVRGRFKMIQVVPSS